MLFLATQLLTSSTTITTWLHIQEHVQSSELTRKVIFVSKEAQTTAREQFTSMSRVLKQIKCLQVTLVIINFLTMGLRAKR